MATILCIDDDRDMLNLLERILTSEGYAVLTVENGKHGLGEAVCTQPDLILLDVMMPEMDGYDVCARLQAYHETAFIPVVFLTAMGEEQNRARAFVVGGVDYMVKPVHKNDLLEMVQKHLATGTAWRKLRADDNRRYEEVQSRGFLDFKEHLATRFEFDPEMRYRLSKAIPTEIYALCAELGIGEGALSRSIAEYLDLPFISHINPETIRLGVMSTAFCKANRVLPIHQDLGETGFIISNPFDQDLIEILRIHCDLDPVTTLSVAEPSLLDLCFTETPSLATPVTFGEKNRAKSLRGTSLQEDADGEHPVTRIAQIILNTAAVERASDVHIEPKENEAVVRFRIDGDLRQAYTLKNKTAKMLISRLKVQGGIDITEKRKPQDGSFMATLDNRFFNLRLSTTSTPCGESLVLRLLEPYVAASNLQKLGMSGTQVDTMVAAASRSSGMILIVGATGSGKTTTIYSLLHAIDHGKRAIMSVEDPVEYRIPFVNQQQVNEKAGVSFEALLKASVRQDPDVLFMGEIRDGFSAKMAFDFASTGHLTITSLHTSNATTALFRLQRLVIDRGTMADTIAVIVAQKLLKKLCQQCRQLVPISSAEAKMLAPFTEDLPSTVAHPVGCPGCRNVGYKGREGVYEVLEFDADIAERVRSGDSIASIRAFARKRGDELISEHAVAKVRDFTFSPKDILGTVLAEEEMPSESHSAPDLFSDTSTQAGNASILVIEDDEQSGKLIASVLQSAGYSVRVSMDGIDGLLYLGKGEYDLIISDIDMPELDGVKLIEMLDQKDLEIPVVFLTASKGGSAAERALELDAVDHITKPINKGEFLRRIQRLLMKR